MGGKMKKKVEIFIIIILILVGCVVIIGVGKKFEQRKNENKQVEFVNKQNNYKNISE